MFNLNQSTFYSVLCALLPCVVFLGFRRKRSWIQGMGCVLFVLYLWQVYDVTGCGGLSDVLYAPEGAPFFRARVSLIPLQHLGKGFLLNIAMCVPLGIFLPLLWKGFRAGWKTVTAGAGFSLLIELSQLLTARAVDVDDLLANTLGAGVGYLLWRAAGKFIGPRLLSANPGIWEGVTFMGLSFGGMFFLYYPFWFDQVIAPVLFGR